MARRTARSVAVSRLPRQSLRLTGVPAAMDAAIFRTAFSDVEAGWRGRGVVAARPRTAGAVPAGRGGQGGDRGAPADGGGGPGGGGDEAVDVDAAAGESGLGEPGAVLGEQVHRGGLGEDAGCAGGQPLRVGAGGRGGGRRVVWRK